MRYLMIPTTNSDYFLNHVLLVLISQRFDKIQSHFSCGGEDKILVPTWDRTAAVQLAGSRFRDRTILGRYRDIDNLIEFNV
jgi:hypothetical protein